MKLRAGARMVEVNNKTRRKKQQTFNGNIYLSRQSKHAWKWQHGFGLSAELLKIKTLT